jgi:alginate O-acetyltransferase complex protein AlgI
VDTFFSNGGIEYCSTVATWYAVVCYSMQVYFDFSGYSDMAIGLGRIFGFHFDENFKHPFLCRDVAEFWQRWHISLGTFFRDYLLYLPVFGHRNQYFNLFLVWFSTGLWHGASWNYIIWGLYFGAFILLETKLGKKKLKKIPTVVMHIYNKLVIIIGFGIFYFENVHELGTFFKALVGLNGMGFIDSELKVSFMNNVFLFIGAIVLTFPVFEPIKKLANSTDSNVKVVVGNVLQTSICLFLFVFSSILLVDATNNPFLYFKF